MKHLLLFVTSILFTMNIMAQDIEWKHIYNTQTGEAVYSLPLPRSWKQTQQGFEGPNQIKVQIVGGSVNHLAMQVQSAEQLFNQYLKPQFPQNARVLSIIPMKKTTQIIQNYNNALWSAGASQKYVDVIGIESLNEKQQKEFAVLTVIKIVMQHAAVLSFNVNILSADAHTYEQAKRSFIYANENLQFNQQAIAAHNQREQQKAQVTWSNIQRSKMADRRGFAATQAKINQTNNEILDMQMDSYQRRSDMMDHSQRHLSNMMLEEQSMYDPTTGERFNVQQGNLRYFSNGTQYFGTDNLFYNPFLDPNASPAVREVYPDNN